MPNAHDAIVSADAFDAAHEVRAFIVEAFLFGQDSEHLDGPSLIDAGILDSTGVVELATFLEERFSIAIADEEMLPENLDSLAGIAAFVQRKRAEV